MTSFLAESWTWYSATMCVVIARYTSRIWHFRSVWKLKVEDWFMLFIVGLYTVLIVFLNVDKTVKTNLINPAEPVDLTPSEIRQRTWGSKTVLLVEQCMCGVQWGGKGCLLILYWRLTQNLRQHLVVKLVTVYVVVTYCVMFILYFGVWCRPFHDYWKVPTDNIQCTTALNHLRVNLSFNVSSDLMIMAIPLPLLLKQHLPFKKRILMALPFSLGIFTMVCAILSKVSSFENPYSVEWVYWYCREASTVMIVSNMPYAWGLLRRVFKLRSLTHDSDQTTTQTSNNVQQLEGQSVTHTQRQQSASKSRKRSWPWNRMSITANGTQKGSVHQTTNPTNPTAGNVLPTGDKAGKDEPDPSPSSSDNSLTGPLARPSRAHNAADAIDRLYNLDAIDDEPLNDQEHAPQRGYNG